MEVSPVTTLSMLEILKNIFKAEVALPWINPVLFCGQSWSWIFFLFVYLQSFRTMSNELGVFPALFRGLRTENTYFWGEELTVFISFLWQFGKIFQYFMATMLYQLPFSLTVRKERLYFCSERSVLSGLFLPEKYATCTHNSQSLSFTFRLADWLYSCFLFKTEFTWCIRSFEYFVNIWSG